MSKATIGPMYREFDVVLEVNGKPVTKRVWATDRDDASQYVKNVLRHCRPKLLQAHRAPSTPVTPEATAS